MESYQSQTWSGKAKVHSTGCPRSLIIFTALWFEGKKPSLKSLVVRSGGRESQSRGKLNRSQVIDVPSNMILIESTENQQVG